MTPKLSLGAVAGCGGGSELGDAKEESLGPGPAPNALPPESPPNVENGEDAVASFPNPEAENALAEVCGGSFFGGDVAGSLLLSSAGSFYPALLVLIVSVNLAIPTVASEVGWSSRGRFFSGSDRDALSFAESVDATLFASSSSP